MDITVRNNNSEVIASGSIIVPYGGYAEFVIKGLIFRISFHTDSTSNIYARYELNTDNNGVAQFMEVKAYNFNDSTLTSLNNRMPLARVDGRSLSLHFSVSSINRRHEGDENSQMIEDKFIFYSWYLDRS